MELQIVQQLCYQLLAVLCCTKLPLAQSAYEFKVDMFKFTVVDRILIMSQSERLEQRGNRSYISGHIMVSAPIKDITMASQLELTRKGYPPRKFFDFRTDCCEIFKGINRSKLVQTFINNMNGFVNVKPQCPLQAHFNYTLSNAYVDEKLFPAFMPDCSFLFKMQFYHRQAQLAYVNVTGRLKSTKFG